MNKGAAPMLTLVTGATGRIGAHLVRALLARGHGVRAFAIPGDPRASHVAGPGVEVVHGRLEDPAAVGAAVAGVEAIVHLGGALTSRGNTDDEYVDFNIRGTYNVLSAARDRAPRLRRVLYASSDAVYWKGPSSGAVYLPVDEAHPRLAGTVYGASKLCAEELCFAFQRGWGLAATILRFGATCDAAELVDPASVFGRWSFLSAAIGQLAALAEPTPEQRAAIAALRRLDEGGERVIALADAEGAPEVRQWGDARDVAAGCVLALESEAAAGEVFNLGGVAPFSSLELARHLADRLGLRCVVANLPIARAPWYISSAKARLVLGYRPSRTVFDMVDEALSSGPSPSARGRGD